MKRLNYFLLAFATLGMVFTSCTPDENAIGPSLQITSGESVDATGGSVTITWRADAGDAKLATMTINNALNSPVNDGTTTWNAFEIPNASDGTYEGTVTLSITESTTFTLIVIDKDGLKDSKTVTVTLAAPLTSNGTKQLGAGSNKTLGSYYSVSENTVYKLADINATSASKIDFVFNSTASAATFIAPKASSNTTVKAANRTTKYQKASFDFATATAADLNAVSPTAESITVAVNDVVVFVTNDNVKGVFEVSALTVATDGSITIGIKVK